MAEATAAVWGVWFMGSEDNSPGWCSFNEGKPVTYQVAVAEKTTRERMHPSASFEVREVSPPAGDAFDSSTHAAGCMCENVCREEKERAYGVWLVHAPHSEADWCCTQPGAFPIQPMTFKEAGRLRDELAKRNPNAIYQRKRMGTKPVGCGVCFTTDHSSESCTRVCARGHQFEWDESAAANVCVKCREIGNTVRPSPKPAYLPPRLDTIALPYLLGEDLLTDQEGLAKLLFLSDRQVRRAAAEASDLGEGAAPGDAALERTWELGRSGARTDSNIERACYRAAVDRAATIFALLSKPAK